MLLSLRLVSVIDTKMDDLFGDQSISIDKWLDSVDESQSEENLDPFDSICRPKTTTIEKVLDVSPIKSSNGDNSYVYDFEEELSFDKSKSSRKYFKSRRAMDSMIFSPELKSTPKPQKSRKRGLGTALKKSYKRKMSDISLWDKAMQKSV